MLKLIYNVELHLIFLWIIFMLIQFAFSEIQCLLTVLEHSPSEIDQHCKTQLGIRQKMWEAASEVRILYKLVFVFA